MSLKLIKSKPIQLGSRSETTSDFSRLKQGKQGKTIYYFLQDTRGRGETPNLITGDCLEAAAVVDRERKKCGTQLNADY